MKASFTGAKAVILGLSFILISGAGVASAQVIYGGGLYGSYGSYQNVYSYPQNYSYYPTTSYSCVQLWSDLRLGSRGSEVSSLQSFLSSRYGQPVTGYFGPQTHANVMRFQVESRLAQTGVVDFSTRAAIMNSCGGYGGGYPTYPSNPTYPDYDYDDDGEITLNYPEGDELFEEGDRVTIEWELEDEPRRSYVKLDLYDDRDRHVYTVKSLSSKNDDYKWKIPQRLEGDFYIRATLYAENGYSIDSDESDEFEIED